MVDVLTPEQRRFNMSRIRGRDTKPELKLRQGLHKMGFRFRLHRKDLAGRPDLTFAGRQAVIFVHGCFWHGHDCPMCRLPATRPEFWKDKIDGNRQRDGKVVAALLKENWRVLIVWECALRGPCRLPDNIAIEKAGRFLQADGMEYGEIAGSWEARSDDPEYPISRD